MLISCPICSDTFVPSSSLVSTPCGHIFHAECVMQWFERSKSCPQCRKSASDRSILRIFLNISTNESHEDPAHLCETIDNLNLQLRNKSKELKDIKADNSDLHSKVEVFMLENKNLSDKNVTLENQVKALKMYMKGQRGLEEDLKLMRREKDKVESELKTFKSLRTVLSGSVSEAEEAMLQNCDGTSASKALVTINAALKKSLVALEERLKMSRKEKDDMKQNHLSELHNMHQQYSALEKENISLRKKMVIMKNSIDSPSAGNSKDKIISRLLFESPKPEALSTATHAEVTTLSSGGLSNKSVTIPQKSSLKPQTSSSSLMATTNMNAPKKTRDLSVNVSNQHHPLTSKSIPNSKTGLSRNLSGAVSKPNTSRQPTKSVSHPAISNSSLFGATRVSRLTLSGSLNKRLYDASHNPPNGMVFNGLGGTVRGEQPIVPKKKTFTAHVD